MRLEELIEASSRIVEQTKKLKKRIDEFDSKFTTRWREAVRRSVIDNIKAVSQAVVNQAKAKKGEIKSYTVLYESKAVLVHSYHTPNTTQYNITADMVEKDSVEFYLTHGPESGLLFYRVEIFENIIQELKADIREGKSDQRLHENAKQLIYRKMSECITC